jgi:opacity protein-like surface antigen
VSNLFAQSSFGVYTFDSLAAFQDGGIGSASSYTVSGALSGGPVQSADFNAGQYSVYAQDQFQVSETFSLTGGVRIDIPVFNDQPVYADQVNIDFGNPEVPSGQLMFNPRVGFNWDIESEVDQQLRGGVGLFTGNPAYVWMSNAYSNNGTGLGILRCGESNPNGLAPAFSPDPANQTLSCAQGTADGGGTVAIGDGSFLGEVDLVNGGTQFPQVFRANLAYDRRLPEDFLLTVEGIYNKGVNDYFIVNRNLQTIAGTGVGGRVMYGTIGSDGRSDPVYFRPDVYGTGSTGVFDLINTASNSSYNLTLGLQKFVGDNIRLTGAYTYSHSEDVQSFTSSRATSNWRFGRVNAGDQLLDPATTSSFDRPHKLTMSGSYTLPFSEEFPTSISAIYIGYSGTPYTYISGGSSGRGDLNADGIVGNDPLYIPTGIGDPNIAFDSMGDEVAFDALINSLDCVGEQRGQIMERNSCRNPWQNFLDLSVKQGFPQFAGGNRFSLQLGVYNFLNLLNEDWGQIETAGGGNFDTQTLLRVEDPDGRAEFENFSYSGPDIMEDGTDALYDNNGDPRNSWQLQLQLRYEF